MTAVISPTSAGDKPLVAVPLPATHLSADSARLMTAE